MFLITPEIRSQIDRRIVWADVALAFKMITRRTRGDALVALCLFHQEKTPSLWMWPSGRFLCHGCGASGDIIEFVQLHQHFVEPRDLLAFLTNLPVAPSPDQIPLEL